jgi:hypothetical protein
MRILVALALVACSPPGSGTPTTRPAPLAQSFTLTDLVGGWRWMLRTTEDGTTRIEDETWRFKRIPGSYDQLAGRYVRSVEVRSEDRLPFQCNQRPWYRQRAVFELAVQLTPTGFTVKESDHHAEPSPCDHGFRHKGEYAVELGTGRMTLVWEGGSQTLFQVDDDDLDLPADPWPATPAIIGPWRWDVVSYDDDGNLRTEHEWWEITARSATQLDVTYRRRVIVNQRDGRIIPCANAPTWSFDDAYVLTGQREEEHWRFNELATEPGDHPCLKTTPARNLDEATAEQLGDFLVMEWRGKRRQVLYRPD